MSHPPLTRHIGLALALLALGACDGNDIANDTTTAVPPSSTTTGTTTAPPATTTTPTTPSTPVTTTTSSTTSSTLLTVTTPTTPNTTLPTAIENEDFVAVLQGLLDRRDEINAAPDPKRAGEVYAGGSLLADFEEQLTNKQTDGLRTVDGDPWVVLSAVVVGVPPAQELGELVELRAVQQYPVNWGRVVDAAGNTVYELVPNPAPTEPTVELRYTLLRSAGAWRIAFVSGA